MSSVPSISYREIVRALERDGWVVVRQRGSHIRLHKHLEERTLKLTVPAHRTVVVRPMCTASLGSLAKY